MNVKYIFFILLIFFTFASPVYAQSPPTLADLQGFLVRILQFTYSIGGIVFFALLVFLGFQWLISRGSQEKIEEIRQKILYWLAGFVLFFLSGVIVNFFFDFFEVNVCGNTGNNIEPGFNIVFNDACP